jgi:heat-inducible transcriptional repressor
MVLTERQLEIVLSVVYEYIRSGESVGSRTVSKRYLSSHSPATIRNEMADLEGMGFLAQPHASAGRIPTTRAYRLYVDSVLQRQRHSSGVGIPLAETLIRKRRDLEGFLDEASDLLGRLTHYVGIGAIAPLKDVVVRSVGFFKVDTRNVLLVVVLEGGLVHQKVITVPWELSSDELEELSRRLNLVASGRPWGEVKSALEGYLMGELSRFSEACRLAIATLGEMLGSSPVKVFTGRVSQMLNLPDFQDLSRLKAFFSLLEQEEELADLVARHSLGNGVSVVIGEEAQRPGLEECSLVLASSPRGGAKAIVGILGPKRMDYERVIALLENVAKAMEDVED